MSSPPGGRLPGLLIRLKRAVDGSAALTCVRADGSRTWQRQTGGRGAVFPAHDLTHYAVETALAYHHGFYGLIAGGWEISDFAAPYVRGPIPSEARQAELLVGVFDTQRLMGPGWTPAEVREQASRYATYGHGARDPMVVPVLSDADIERVIAVRADVLDRWAVTGPGQTLELEFTRADARNR
jgi:hypothetical protein